MKLTTRIICSALIIVMLFSLVACGSSFNKIKKNFENEGYTYIESEDNSTVASITAELEEGDISCSFHFFKETDAFISRIVIIAEFASDKELAKAFAEDGSETLKGLIKDAQKSEYVNGNCVLLYIPLVTPEEAIEIFGK